MKPKELPVIVKRPNVLNYIVIALELDRYVDKNVAVLDVTIPISMKLKEFV